MTEIHTMSVPLGCTVEQAWGYHCAGIPKDARYGEQWVNLEIDSETREILSADLWEPLYVVE